MPSQDKSNAKWSSSRISWTSKFVVRSERTKKMELMFEKLDTHSNQIETLYECRFLETGYADKPEPERTTADLRRQTELRDQANEFVRSFLTEKNAMDHMIDLLNEKLHSTAAQVLSIRQARSTSGARDRETWNENRMFKPQEVLSKETSPADMDLWVESMEQYAESSYILMQHVY